MSRDREQGGEEQESGKKIKREMMKNITTADGKGMGRRQTAALNIVTPCAACKLLRRRCAEECPFSPYFSPHEPHKFAAVHKVFGASNVSKMLLEVPESQRGDAANSLVYEANLRLRDPVYGCMGAISALHQQIQSLQSELSAVRSHLLRLKFSQPPPTTTTVASLIPSAVPMVSSQPNPAPPPTPPMPSIGVSSSSSSSNSSTTTSVYNPPSTTAAYSSISTDNNVPYFD